MKMHPILLGVLAVVGFACTASTAQAQFLPYGGGYYQGQGRYFTPSGGIVNKQIYSTPFGSTINKQYFNPYSGVVANKRIVSQNFGGFGSPFISPGFGSPVFGNGFGSPNLGGFNRGFGVPVHSGFVNRGFGGTAVQFGINRPGFNLSFGRIIR